MREDYEKISQTDIPIVVIVPADIEHAKGYWERNKIPVSGLADPEREVMKAYGQEFKLPKLGWMPVAVALDKNHKVAYTHYGKSQRDIATSSEIIEKAMGLAGD